MNFKKKMRRNKKLINLDIVRLYDLFAFLGFQCTSFSDVHESFQTNLFERLGFSLVMLLFVIMPHRGQHPFGN